MSIKLIMFLCIHGQFNRAYIKITSNSLKLHNYALHPRQRRGNLMKKYPVRIGITRYTVNYITPMYERFKEQVLQLLLPEYVFIWLRTKMSEDTTLHVHRLVCLSR